MELLKKEFEITFRPWLSQTSADMAITHYVADNGRVFPKKEFDSISDDLKNKFNIVKIGWNIEIKNSGKVPALVRGRDKTIIGKIPTRKDLDANFGHPFYLMPNDSRKYSFERTKKISDAFSKQWQGSFFLCEFEYGAEGDEKKHKYGFISLYRSGHSKIVDTWTEKTFDYNQEEWHNLLEKEEKDSVKAGEYIEENG